MIQSQVFTKSFLLNIPIIINSTGQRVHLKTHFSAKPFIFSHLLCIPTHPFPMVSLFSCSPLFPFSLMAFRGVNIQDIFYSSVFITSGRNLFIRSVYRSPESGVHLMEVAQMCPRMASYPRMAPTHALIHFSPLLPPVNQLIMCLREAEHSL